MNTNDSQLVIRDTPIALRLFGLVFAGAGMFIFFESKMEEAYTLLFVIIGLGVLLFSSALTISADRLTRIVSLEYRSLLYRNIKQIPFDEIAGINVERSHSRRRSTYRVVVQKKDGQVVPLRSYYSSGSYDKEQQASQLRAFIGAQGPDAPAAQLVQSAIQGQQAFSSPADAFHETSGVRWQVQPGTAVAALATRWFSPDFKTPGAFLLLAQKADGQDSALGGLLASLGDSLFRQSISLYGFQESDTPGLDQAARLTPLDPSLEPHFAAFTNDRISARQTLNPWAVMPLANWGRRYPLKAFQTGGNFNQIIVLFGPNGVYLATPNALQPGQVEELTALGVELVKSQGSSGNSSSAF